MRRHLVLRIITKLLMPFILLFALYVSFTAISGLAAASRRG